MSSELDALRARVAELEAQKALVVKALRDRHLPDVSFRVVAQIVLDPTEVTEADIARGQELAERYGWR